MTLSSNNPNVIIARQTITMPPELLENIKESILILLKSDKNLLKEVISTFFQQERDFVKNLIIETAQIDDEIQILEIDKESAKVQIQEYIIKHPGCGVGEIVQDLKIDPDMVIEIVNEFKKGNVLTSKPNE